jgi:molybdopterin-containing oxidoreductase family membrane subunit
MSAVFGDAASPSLLARGQTHATVTEAISAITLHRHFGWYWLAGFASALALCLLLVFGVGWLLHQGVGIWGINMPVAWAFAICNYVWWIGIGMGGTFISGALYLARKDWRNSINRYAEAMTVFAVAVSGIFPILHLGRPWFFYWLFPYPDVMNVWPQWRSSLEWDFFAILAYLTVSILYWYVGMIPDLATLRDRAPTLGLARFYGFFALGWRGEARQWRRFETRDSRCRWFFPCTAWLLWISPRLWCRGGTRRSFRHSSLPARCFPVLRWCWCSAYPCAACSGCRITSPMCIWLTWPK